MNGASRPVPSGKAAQRAVRRVENLSSVARTSPVVGSFSVPGLMEGMKFLFPPAAGLGVGLFPGTKDCDVPGADGPTAILYHSVHMQLITSSLAKISCFN